MISVAHNLRQVTRALDDFAKKQVPYAAALALNAVAADVQKAEQANMSKVLDRPTPFTLKSIRIQRATKRNLTAVVFVMDAAARYLEPYEVGGDNVLNGKALIKPIGQPTNQYGNLPRRTIASLKGRSDIFIGKVKTKKGVVDGVWQRTAGVATVVTKTGKVRRTRKGLNQTGKLKLLLAFTDAHPVRQRLRFGEVAKRVVAANFRRRFEESMARAMRTAK